MPTSLELPFIIRTDMDEQSLKQAVQQNFDHIIGNLAWLGSSVNKLGGAGGAGEDAEGEGEGTSGETVEDLEDDLNEAGVGRPDGDPPTNPATDVIVRGGIGDWLQITFDTAQNNSLLIYDVHCINETTRTARGGAGWTPQADTKVGEVTAPGQETFLAQHTIKAFPTGHVHAGALEVGVNYYVKVQVRDFDGMGPVSNEAVGQVSKLVSEQITDATIDLATKIQGLLPNANLAQITDPAKLASAVVTAGKLAPGAVNNSNLIASDVIVGNHILGGSIVAGKLAADSVVSNNIQAGNILTNHMTANTISGDRIAAGSLHADKIIAGTIATGHLSATAIDGMTIRGVTIRAGTYETFDTGQAGLKLTTNSQKIIWVNPVDEDQGDTDYITFRSGMAAGERAKIDRVAGHLEIQNTKNKVLIHGHHSVEISSGDGITGGWRTKLHTGAKVLGASLVTANQMIQIGENNDTNNKLRLRNTGGAIATPPTGFCDIILRADLSPNELRVSFANGFVKTLATAS